MKKYIRVCHLSIWFGNKIALSRVVKKAYYKGFWSDAGGKVEEYEHIEAALKREVKEEMGIDIENTNFRLVDCFLYDKRKIKSFLYELNLPDWWFNYVKNTEPHKQGPWKLFTLKQALKLKLMPSVKAYLTSLDK